MSNISWARDNGNGYFLSSLKTTSGYFQTETPQTSQKIFLVKAFQPWDRSKVALGLTMFLEGRKDHLKK